jgi:hypothetical protein
METLQNNFLAMRKRYNPVPGRMSLINREPDLRNSTYSEWGRHPLTAGNRRENYVLLGSIVRTLPDSDM